MTLIKKLIPDSQIFQQDPEGWSQEELEDAATRLKALVTKHRAARGLSMEALVAAKDKPKRTRKKADGSTAGAKS